MNEYLKACDKIEEVANLCTDKWVVDILLNGRDKIMNKARANGVFVKAASSESRIKVVMFQENQEEE